MAYKEISFGRAEPLALCSQARIRTIAELTSHFREKVFGHLGQENGFSFVSTSKLEHNGRLNNVVNGAYESSDGGQGARDERRFLHRSCRRSSSTRLGER